MQQFCRRQQQLLLGSCLLAWRCQQQYQQQQTQQRRMLTLILQAWYHLVHTLRYKLTTLIHCLANLAAMCYRQTLV